jgi:hypothetical protein
MYYTFIRKEVAAMEIFNDQIAHDLAVQVAVEGLRAYIAKESTDGSVYIDSYTKSVVIAHAYKAAYPKILEILYK